MIGRIHLARTTTAACTLLAALALSAPANAKPTYITFDVPGATQGTYPVAINATSVVAGTWEDNNGSSVHGFIRAADGTFTTFDAPSTT